MTFLEKKYLLQLRLVRQTQYSNFQPFQSDTCTFRPSHMIPIENQKQTSHCPVPQFVSLFVMLHLAFDQTRRCRHCSKHGYAYMSLYRYKILDTHQSSDTKACRYCTSMNAVIAIWRWFLSCRKRKKLEKKKKYCKNLRNQNTGTKVSNLFRSLTTKNIFYRYCRAPAFENEMVKMVIYYIRIQFFF